MGDPGDRKRDALQIGVLAKATRVLDVFRTPPHEFGLSALARETGLDRSAVQRITHTLHGEGWLLKNPATRRFSPSIKMLEGAFGYLCADPLMQAASPHVVSLARELHETVNVARLDGSDIVYVTRLPAQRAAYVATVVGRRVPALNTSSGRVILSTRPEPEIAQICDSWPIRQWNDHTTMDRARIYDEILSAKRLGYTIAEEEILPNELDMAAPIRDQAGITVGAVQMAVSNLRWDRPRLRSELLPGLVEVSKAISPLSDSRL